MVSRTSTTLASANFTLRKWNSNDLNVLKKISETRKEQEDKVYVCGDLQAKTLGLVSPVTVLAKVFMQKLWENKVDWDQALPNHLCSEWHNVIKSMHAVNMIRAPRYLVCTDTSSNELHCFSDASEKAYAACIYLKTTEPNGSCNVHLVCAKTKVAPLKSLTIPRLELCGALLLTRLTVKTVSALKLTISRTIYWTDSTIVLSWIRTSPHLLKTFVANRITEIQNASFVENWRHVPTNDNPADIASRGVYENTLEHCKLWWHGPSWLSQELAFRNQLANNELPAEEEKERKDVRGEGSIIYEGVTTDAVKANPFKGNTLARSPLSRGSYISQKSGDGLEDEVFAEGSPLSRGSYISQKSGDGLEDEVFAEEKRDAETVLQEKRKREEREEERKPELSDEVVAVLKALEKVTQKTEVLLEHIKGSSKTKTEIKTVSKELGHVVKILNKRASELKRVQEKSTLAASESTITRDTPAGSAPAGSAYKEDRSKSRSIGTQANPEDIEKETRLKEEERQREIEAQIASKAGWTGLSKIIDYDWPKSSFMNTRVETRLKEEERQREIEAQIASKAGWTGLSKIIDYDWPKSSFMNTRVVGQKAPS
ncbi:Pao retrotransposon peptidase [Popillia japonica]|uniref:Pao retrotransposon peptidase n=1 Tax=Popillia japonica TaxID=7064 RepID=A0AAW1IAR4_POPJA